MVMVSYNGIAIKLDTRARHKKNNRHKPMHYGKKDIAVKALLHYVLGLRFGNLKSSKMHEKLQPTRVFT